MKSALPLQSEKKRLLICRHAKSSWHDTALSDMARPLNKRGERDAPEMGRRLKHRGLRPDLIMASPAVRARTTAEILATKLDYPGQDIRILPELYAASVATLLALLKNIDPKIATVLMVGHNPECTSLVNILGGLQIENVPTCGIVALEFAQISWAELAPGKGDLLFWDYPKKQ